MIKAVIFDLDGTLVHFKIDYKNAREQVKNYLTRLGVPEEYMLNQPIFTALEQAIRYLKSRKTSESEVNRIKEDINKIVSQFELKAANETFLTPNAKETLSEVKRLGVKIGLFTINNRQVTEIVLNKTGIKKFFNIIVSRDDTSAIKPDDEHLLTVTRKLGVEPEQSVVVGDTVYDFQAAKRLGALTIGVEGLYDATYLKNEGKVDYVVKDLSEIINIINRFII
ncbi:MAG: HAD family hydrolase [Candidatus Odinarchaeota archaeon]